MDIIIVMQHFLENYNALNSYFTSKRSHAHRYFQTCSNFMRSIKVYPESQHLSARRITLKFKNGSFSVILTAAVNNDAEIKF